MTGFQDGAGNPAPERDVSVAIVPDGQAGEGGSFIIAQRWVHDLDYFNDRPVAEQEGMFGRTKGSGSQRLSEQPKVSVNFKVFKNVFVLCLSSCFSHT